MKLFSCENITKYYREIPTIEDVFISVNQGELVGLLGTSGVGKTTLFNILSGVDNPDAGKVFLKGKDITGKSGSVSYMLQKDLLLPHKTIIENISLPLVIKGTDKKTAESVVMEHLPQFGLTEYEHSYPKTLSGGMRQRAALLRTFLMGGEIVLLDEPFSALDPLTKEDLHKWYLKTAGELNVSTLFITHDIDEALMLSNRIYVLAGKPGKIVKEITNLPKDKTGFALTAEFLQHKSDILKAMNN